MTATTFVVRRTFLITLFWICCTAMLVSQSAKRPMTFMDIMEMRSVGSPALSRDGDHLLYTYSIPDWKAAKSFTDIYYVSTEHGLPSTRQMTFTKDRNETTPRWLPDGVTFVFLSNRDAAEGKPINQLYSMRTDGGEALRLTDAKDGVGQYAISKDGKWIVFSAGKEDERQLWVLPVEHLHTAKPTQLTKHAAPITNWQIAPDSKRIYFLSPDSVDRANKQRKEKKFDVHIRHEETPPVHLWSLDFETKKTTRLTSAPEYSVHEFRISEDAKWISFRGIPNNRYRRNITETTIYGDLYLLEVATGTIERLTNNKDIGEGVPSFSPDGSLIAFTAPNEFTYFRNDKIYVRKVSEHGGTWRKLGDGYDGDMGITFWSEDGSTIYFNDGWKATTQLFAVSLTDGKVTRISQVVGVLSVNQDEHSKQLLLNYSDPTTPSNLYFASSITDIPDRSRWKQLTDSNPQVREMALGETEEIEWKSNDGTSVGGVLVKPIGYEKGKRYPLIVQIHGGPASASLLNFIGSYGYYSHIYAAAGYAVLLPNYRGSTNYGEKFKMEISGDYFRKGYEDIMSGVDHLVRTGLVDGDKMGVMGWSAGGHWSNWILTHTNRFKAISSGAGTMNWISMYAQTDVQRTREFYFRGTPYDRFDHYWDVSPLKYIKNAKTPTLIHVVDGDPRVPRPQSEELYMALVKLGVPTEFFVYPGTTHGITEPRNQLVKMFSEFHWMEKWIKGKAGWFDWNDLLKTLKEDEKKEEKAEEKREAGS